MLAVPVVASVHEEMHHDAGEEQDIRQGAEQVGAVFGEEEQGGDAEEYEESGLPAGSGSCRT